MLHYLISTYSLTLTRRISEAGEEESISTITPEVTYMDIDNIFKQMTELNIELLTITGGEPLLKKDILYYIIENSELLLNGDQETKMQLAHLIEN